jgi:cytochrome c553
MKKIMLILLVVLAAGSVAMAQLTYKGGADVLGAHNGYGRGCVMCHAPHSGSLGNGKASTTDPENGMYALWGQDLTPLYGKTFNFSGDGKATYAVTLPSAPVSAHDANTVILFCLSCHDGVLTNVGMMQGQTVETLPIVGGTAPTLLAKAAPSGGTAYQNDHPVGQNAIVSCNSTTYTYGWDCTGGGNTTTAITMNGAASSVFLTKYPASFWNSGSNPLATFGTTVNAVTCTTCHDQHSMTVYTNNNGSYSTMFFIRGYYNPAANGNSVAQFCRNCHGGESNEMHGLMNVPTV